MLPPHNGLLLVIVGVAGVGLTTTVVDPVAPGQPATETVRLYVPALAAVTLVITGF